jgi:hypothetical protein
MRQVLAAMGMIALGSMFWSATAVSATSASLPATTGGVHGYTGIAGHPGHTFTSNELRIIASQSDLVVGLPVQIRAYAATLRKDNPAIQFYVYENGMFGQSEDCGKFPKSWLLYNTAGNPIYSRTNHNCLMNPFSTQSYGGSAGWTASLVHACRSDLGMAKVAVGCFLDQMSAVGVSNFVTSMPVDPQTHKLFTVNQYLSAVGKVGNAVAAAMPVIANSYESGRKYFTGPTRMLDSTNIGMFEAEHWLGSTQPRDAHNLGVWQQAVQMLIDSQAGGHGVLVNFDDVSTSLSQWQAYNVATMMLGNNGHVWLHFDSSNKSGPDSWQLDCPILHMRLGSPTETHSTVAGYLKGGVYQRTFASGLAIANPSGKTVTVKLAHTYITPSGAKVTKVSIAPYSGTLLKG